MATLIQSGPPPATGQNVGVGQINSDDWRQVEDYDWQDQLLAEINNVQQDTHANNHQNRTNQDTIDDIAPVASSEYSIKQAPIKHSLLTRPMSSHEDLATGFSFTKAKPVQQLDFSLKGKRNNETTESHPRKTPPSQSSAPKIAQDAMSAPRKTTPPTKQILASTTSGSNISVPFPNIIIPDLQESRASGANITDVPDDQKYCSDAKEARTVPVYNDDRPDGPDSMDASTLSQTHREPLHASNDPQQIPSHTNRRLDQAALVSAQGRPKVTKTQRRKTMAGRNMSALSHPANDHFEPTEEEIYSVLVYRHQREKEAKERLAAEHNAQEVQLRELREVRSSLYDQLQEIRQRESEKEATLAKFKAVVPKWETKIQKLRDFVQGLANDHHKLRDDAKDIQERQDEVQRSKKTLQDTLATIYQEFGGHDARSKYYVTEARHNVEILEQTVQHQEIQLRENANSLQDGRDRSERLQCEMTRIADGHGQLLQIFADHRAVIVEELQHLLKSSEKNQAVAPPDPQVRSMLEDCVRLLQDLRKADIVKPQDVRKLTDSVNGFSESILQSVQACEQTSTMTEAGQRQLASDLQEQIRALRSNISTEQALSEQVMDLREVKATVRERLQATESALVRARQEVLALQNKEQEQSRRLAALELAATRARSDPAEAPQALVRLQEMEYRNRDLQGEIIALQSKAAEISSQAQQKDSAIAQLEDQLTAARKKIEEACTKATRLEEEKALCESQAVMQREEMRMELSKVAKMEIANVKSQHLNALQQLNQKKVASDRKLEDILRQLDDLKIEKEKTENDARLKIVSLKRVQTDEGHATAVTKSLRSQVTELEKQIETGKISHVRLQESLSKAKADNHAKDEQIIDLQSSLQLQASLATASSSKHNTDTSPRPSSSRSKHFTKGSTAVVEDSQQNDMPAATVMENMISGEDRPVSSRSKRSINRLPAVVEDSQPNDIPGTVAMENMMLSEKGLSDPYWGYPGDGCQPTGDDDLSGLFPATPGTHTRELDFSHTSVTRTRVTSRDISDKPQPHMRRQTSSHEAQSHTQSHTQPQAHGMLEGESGAQARPIQKRELPSGLDTFTAPAPTHGKSPRKGTNSKPLAQGSMPRKSSITVAKSPRSAVPHGILKNPNGTKRTASTAEVTHADTLAGPSKKTKGHGIPEAKSKGLGPIIPESQSPRLYHGRGRKLSTRPTKTSKDDKMALRFSQGA